MDFFDLKTQQEQVIQGVRTRMERVFSHGHYILGPEVFELEARLSEYVGGAAAITCSNGTDALVLALLSLGVGAGDAVFVPALSFVSTAEAVVRVGARPVFVDVDRATLNISVGALEVAIEKENRAGRSERGAALTVDLFGRPAPYGPLVDLCQKYGLFLISDGAQSFGATYLGRACAMVCPTYTTSFFPTKPLGCFGDGGAVFCQDEAQLEKIRSARVHGKDGAGRFVRRGLNARLDTLQAAVLLEKLTIFDDELRQRREVAERYEHLLEGTGAVLPLPAGVESAWALFCVVLPEARPLTSAERRKRREEVRRQLQAASVPTRVYYETPLHLEPAFQVEGQNSPSLPIAEELSDRLLCLPFHPHLTLSDQEQVAVAFRASLG